MGEDSKEDAEMQVLRLARSSCVSRSLRERRWALNRVSRRWGEGVKETSVKSVASLLIVWEFFPCEVKSVNDGVEGSGRTRYCAVSIWRVGLEGAGGIQGDQLGSYHSSQG